MTEKKIRSIQVTTEDSFINAELMKKELQVNRQSFISKDNDSYIVSSIEEQIEVNKEEALLSELKTFFSVISGEKNVDYPGINSSLESLKFCESIKEKINND